MALYSDYHLNLIKAFINNNVRFLIIGGHAAIFHGINRNTGNLDILIEPTEENGVRIMKAFFDLKLEITELTKEEFTRDIVLSFGFIPNAVDIINFTRESRSKKHLGILSNILILTWLFQ